MKNICVNIMALIAAINMALFTACSDSGDDRQTLSATPTELTFTANETQTQTVTITTNADFWFVEKSDDWVKYSKSGNTLFLSVQNYTNTIDVRTATVTIMTGGEAQPVEVLITQKTKVPNTFSVTPTSLSYDANEIGDRKVVITTDAEDWEANTNASWITLVKQDNILNVFASEENTALTPRTANIKITAGDAPDITLAVTQAAVIYLYGEPDSLQFKADGIGEKLVKISTNATGWDAIADSSWVKVIKQNNVLKVSINKPNTALHPRIANVKITADKARDFILPVTQAATILLSANPGSLSFRANETTKRNVAVSTNAGSWDASTNASWVKLTKQDDILGVAVERNTSGSTRDAEIIITADDEILSIPIAQAN